MGAHVKMEKSSEHVHPCYFNNRSMFILLNRTFYDLMVYGYIVDNDFESNGFVFYAINRTMKRAALCLKQPERQSRWDILIDALCACIRDKW